MSSDPILELAKIAIAASSDFRKQRHHVNVTYSIRAYAAAEEGFVADRLRSRLKRVVIVYEWSNVYNDWAEAGEFASDNEASIFENSVLCRRSAKFKRSTHFVLESKKGGV